jgi:hypothetical protein
MGRRWLEATRGAGWGGWAATREEDAAARGFFSVVIINIITTIIIIIIIIIRVTVVVVVVVGITPRTVGVGRRRRLRRRDLHRTQTSKLSGA